MEWYLVSYVVVYTIKGQEYRHPHHSFSFTDNPAKVLLDEIADLKASRWYKTKYLREYQETGEIHVGPAAHPRLITKIQIKRLPEDHRRILQKYLWFLAPDNSGHKPRD